MTAPPMGTPAVGSDEDMQRFLPEGMLWLRKDKTKNNERKIQPTCVGYTNHMVVTCQ
jgi:hypothetical protein